MARKPAREAAMSLLYQKLFNQSIEEDQIKNFQDMSSDLAIDELDIPYIKDILNGFDNHKDEIDNIIRDNSKGWKFDRISKVDLSILRLALYEIIYRDDIPDSVAANEAVELGKKYGGDKSGAFINGILGTYLRSLDDTEE